MGGLTHVLDELVADADAAEPDAAEWISRGRGPDEPVLSAVAVAFGQRACSTAARGVERPERSILLAGAWRTPIAWPLLDVAAAAHLAYDGLVDERGTQHRAPRSPGGEAGRAILTSVAGDGPPAAASRAWALAVRADAAGALEHRSDPSTRLRDLVRDVERELYHAAKSLALRAEAAALGLVDPEPSSAAAPDPCAAALVRAAGHAIAAASVAPALAVTAADGPWANLVNRYYH